MDEKNLNFLIQNVDELARIIQRSEGAGIRLNISDMFARLAEVYKKLQTLAEEELHLKLHKSKTRKIVQISTVSVDRGNRTVALCDDGTLWVALRLTTDPDWFQMPLPPASKETTHD